MDELAGFAGGTLGYIVNNVPGAVAGYKIGKGLKQRFGKYGGRIGSYLYGSRSGNSSPNMPKRRSSFSTPRSARRRLSFSSSQSTPGRRHATTPSRNRLLRLMKGSIAPPAVVGQGSRDVRMKVRGRRKVYKPKKKVRVTRKFSRMVGKVLEGKTKSGFFQKTWVGRMAIPNQGEQTIQGPAIIPDIGLHFSPNQIMDATSVLWNQKALLPVGTTPQMTDAGNFDPFATKVHIKKLWSVYEFKSNSQRTHYFKFFVCRPKVADVTDAPSNQWQAILSDMTIAGINVNNTAVTTPHADPRSLPQFNKYWDCEVSNITIEPGQSFKKVVKGPSELTYDFAKMYKSTVGTAQPATIKASQYTARWVFVIHLGELAGTTLLGVDRANTAAVVNNVPGILYERNDYYTLSIPENAGWIAPGGAIAAGAKPLGLVRDAYCIYNTDLGDVDGTVANRVDEENPANIVGAPQG